MHHDDTTKGQRRNTQSDATTGDVDTPVIDRSEQLERHLQEAIDMATD